LTQWAAHFLLGTGLLESTRVPTRASVVDQISGSVLLGTPLFAHSARDKAPIGERSARVIFTWTYRSLDSDPMDG
jgi:hypothetical protein